MPEPSFSPSAVNGEEPHCIPSPRAQMLVGVGVVLVAIGMAFGAFQISGNAGNDPPATFDDAIAHLD